MQDGQRAQQRAAPLRRCAVYLFLVLRVHCVAPVVSLRDRCDMGRLCYMLQSV
jgi:hypothetical protein